MKLLETKNLALKAGSKYIFQDINWQIEKGENWVLFGLNGCGKTTLLSVMASYQKACCGEIYLHDYALDEENYGLFREKIGLVSSSFFNRFFRHEIIQVRKNCNWISSGRLEERPWTYISSVSSPSGSMKS